MSQPYYNFDYSELDEYLAEYVDGTMDPAVREVFEELIESDPFVAAQVDYLQSVRSELCRFGDQCKCKAPAGFQARLRDQLACEMLREQPPVLDTWAPPLHLITVAVSAVLLVVVITIAYDAPVVPEAVEQFVTLEQVEGQVSEPIPLSGSQPSRSTLFNPMQQTSSFQTANMVGMMGQPAMQPILYFQQRHAAAYERLDSLHQRQRAGLGSP